MSTYYQSNIACPKHGHRYRWSESHLCMSCFDFYDEPVDPHVPATDDRERSDYWHNRYLLSRIYIVTN
jgi:hypothetical protein